MKRTILLLTLATAISMTMLLTGCGEQNLTTQQRQAKLLANDNLQLKNELKAKDKEIKVQMNLVKDCKKQNARAQEQSGDSLGKMLKIMAETNIELEKLKAENAALKQKLK